MKKLLIFSTLLCGACAPSLPVIAVQMATAPTLDRAINAAVGGTVGKTITGDTAVAAKNGSEIAKDLCGLYDFLVGWVDGIYFTPKEHAIFNENKIVGHCPRWDMHETGELKKKLAEKKK